MMGAFLVASAVAPAQPVSQSQLASDYTIRNWQTEDGLPQNSVTGILQTKDGYLWSGTFNGLVRFDGVKFTTFNTANSPAMGSDSVVCLFEDRLGQLWIGTDGGGLTRYSQGHFLNYPLTNRAGASIVSSLAEDEAGTLWVATDAGLFRMAAGSLEFYEPPAVPEGFGVVRHLCCDRDGQLWISAERGLFVKLGEQVRRMPGYEGVTRLATSDARAVVSFHARRGLVHWQDDAGVLRQTQPAGPADDLPRSIVWCKNGDVWLGTDRGLARLRGSQWTRYSLPDQFRAATVLALYEDRERNVWVGLNGAGLLRLHERALDTISSRDGLPGDDVVVLLEESPGKVWIGGFGLGVGVWEKGRFELLPGLAVDNQSVHALARDAGGRMWVGVREGRLVSWRNGRAETDEAAPQQGARVLFVSRDGDLWIGSRLGGVEHRHHDTGKRTRYTPEAGLSDVRVTAIAEDREGAIWVGTLRGLNRIRQGKITRFYREQGLGSDCVHTLLLDQEGVLWVGTVGGGVAVQLGERFAAIGAAQGLPNDVIGQILEDGRGSLWLGSNGGILRVNRAELLSCARGELANVRCRTFGRREGMLNPECAGGFQPACFKAHDGRLWFASVGGVVIVDPDKLAPTSVPPPVKVEAVFADGRPCQILGTGAATRVRIPAGTTRVQVGYTGLSFVAPEDLRFQFRLDTLNAKWIDAGSERTAYFDRLAPGEYGFHVRACTSDGVWNEPETALRLQVAAFWWQTAWFRWALVAGIVVAFSGLFWLVHARHLRRTLELAEHRNAKLRAEELGVANRALRTRSEELEHALANVKTLRGLIPICSGCKKIRDDKGFWEQVELYVARHSDARFTHGLCPACTEKYFPGLQEED